MNRLIGFKNESRPKLSLKLNRLTKVPRLIGSPLRLSSVSVGNTDLQQDAETHSQSDSQSDTTSQAQVSPLTRLRTGSQSKAWSCSEANDVSFLASGFSSSENNANSSDNESGYDGNWADLQRPQLPCTGSTTPLSHRTNKDNGRLSTNRILVDSNHPEATVEGSEQLKGKRKLKRNHLALKSKRRLQDDCVNEQVNGKNEIQQQKTTTMCTLVLEKDELIQRVLRDCSPAIHKKSTSSSNESARKLPSESIIDQEEEKEKVEVEAEKMCNGDRNHDGLDNGLNTDETCSSRASLHNCVNDEDDEHMGDCHSDHRGRVASRGESKKRAGDDELVKQDSLPGKCLPSHKKRRKLVRVKETRSKRVVPSSSNDFKSPQGEKRKRTSLYVPPRRTKLTRAAHSEYITAMKEEEELQLALAVSASLYQSTRLQQQQKDTDPSAVEDNQKKQRKKRFRVRKNPVVIPPPLLLTSSPEAKRRLVMKVQEMFAQEDSEKKRREEELPCTQPIAPSTLGVPSISSGSGLEEPLGNEVISGEIGKENVADKHDDMAMSEGFQVVGNKVAGGENETGESNEMSEGSQVFSGHSNNDLVDETTRYMVGHFGKMPAALEYKTMWQLSAYSENESIDEFYVEMLRNVLLPKSDATVKCAQCTQQQQQEQEEEGEGEVPNGSPLVPKASPAPDRQDIIATDAKTHEVETGGISDKLFAASLEQLKCACAELLAVTGSGTSTGPGQGSTGHVTVGGESVVQCSDQVDGGGNETRTSVSSDNVTGNESDEKVLADCVISSSPPVSDVIGVELSTVEQEGTCIGCEAEASNHGERGVVSGRSELPREKECDCEVSNGEDGEAVEEDSKQETSDGDGTGDKIRTHDDNVLGNLEPEEQQDEMPSSINVELPLPSYQVPFNMEAPSSVEASPDVEVPPSVKVPSSVEVTPNDHILPDIEVPPSVEVSPNDKVPLSVELLPNDQIPLNMEVHVPSSVEVPPNMEVPSGDKVLPCDERPSGVDVPPGNDEVLPCVEVPPSGEELSSDKGLSSRKVLLENEELPNNEVQLGDEMLPNVEIPPSDDVPPSIEIPPSVHIPPNIEELPSVEQLPSMEVLPSKEELPNNDLLASMDLPPCDKELPTGEVSLSLERVDEEGTTGNDCETSSRKESTSEVIETLKWTSSGPVSTCSFIPDTTDGTCANTSAIGDKTTPDNEWNGPGTGDIDEDAPNTRTSDDIALHSSELAKRTTVPPLENDVSREISSTAVREDTSGNEAPPPSDHQPMEEEPSVPSGGGTLNEPPGTEPVHQSIAIPTSGSQLTKDLQSLLQTGLFADLTVLTANTGRKMSAHRGIICCRCPSMIPLLTASDECVLDLSAFSQDSVQLFLQYIYTGQLQLPTLEGEITNELLTMAELWDIQHIVDLVQNCKDEEGRHVLHGGVDEQGGVGSQGDVSEEGEVRGVDGAGSHKDVGEEGRANPQKDVDGSSAEYGEGSAVEGDQVVSMDWYVPENHPEDVIRIEVANVDGMYCAPNDDLTSMTSVTGVTSVISDQVDGKGKVVVMDSLENVEEAPPTQDVSTQTLAVITCSSETQTLMMESPVLAPPTASVSGCLSEALAPPPNDPSIPTNNNCTSLCGYNNSDMPPLNGVCIHSTRHNVIASLQNKGAQCDLEGTVGSFTSSCTLINGWSSPTTNTTALPYSTPNSPLASSVAISSSTILQSILDFTSPITSPQSMFCSPFSSQPTSPAPPPIAPPQSPLSLVPVPPPPSTLQFVSSPSPISPHDSSHSDGMGVSKGERNPHFPTLPQSPPTSPHMSPPTLPHRSPIVNPRSPLCVNLFNSPPSSIFCTPAPSSLSIHQEDVPSDPLISLPLSNGIEDSLSRQPAVTSSTTSSPRLPTTLSLDNSKHTLVNSTNSLLNTADLSTNSPLNKADLSTNSPLNTADLSTNSPLNTADLSTNSPLNKADLSTNSPLNKADLSTNSPLNTADLSTNSPLNTADLSTNSPNTADLSTNSPLNTTVLSTNSPLNTADLSITLNDSQSSLNSSYLHHSQATPLRRQHHTEKRVPSNLPDRLHNCMATHPQNGESAYTGLSGKDIIYLKEDCCSPYSLDTAQEIEFPNNSFSFSELNNEGSNASNMQNIKVVQATPTINHQTSDDESDVSSLVVSDKHLVTPVLNRSSEDIVNAEVSVALEVSIFSDELDLYHYRDQADKEKFPLYTPTNHKRHLVNDTELISGDNITPMPSYRTMDTPCLKEQCSSYGVRPLPKSKMIAKLEEIYEYTHPMVGKKKDAPSSARGRKKSKGQTRKKSNDHPSSKDSDKRVSRSTVDTEKGTEPTEVTESNELMVNVSKAMKKDKDLYQDIAMYKPLELVYIQKRLKKKGVYLSKERLAEVLDKLSVTFIIPRTRPGKK